MLKSPRFASFLALTIGTSVIAWIWGLSPLGALNSLRQMNWTFAETGGRLAVVFIIWLAATIHLRRRTALAAQRQPARH